ncbi:pyridoxal phosphate-dependent decarboxylase family protein [Paenarthrobacter ilicis]|uniref:Glutamate/tyrosine decarboxylase-like PLP-dependent enzyme n=1 Tax=Paenarthrobacter ilicis TaxID=43665 RepID=A0ABX0THA3_9MICC|nr:aminotransferase class V-fold PLP-dependent enzyme [Paenarthrobacter ilicis]MBM7792110.1 glutamate/tyrosine decarboxylase-like PLP-dependent enzyme [Paenarthrobacter ilicis]NIJ01265.1 glutamate/tyrosine decarboxylase-like PLP-dependent enzyme [Paenarthrobacter ilicis]
MSAMPETYGAALERAMVHAGDWLASVPSRPVRPAMDADHVASSIDQQLQDGAIDPADVVDELAALAEPGLMAIQSGRFFGWVMGGTLPAAMAADWLVTAWDQNAGLRFATPSAAAIEESAAAWLLDLLQLPATADVGFTTGATTANFVGLAAGRQHLMDEAGWDLESLGLTGAPRITTFAGRERHAAVDLALRYLGLGACVPVEADQEGRILPDALAEAMDQQPGPSLVCLQAGNLHSGAFDPMTEAVAVAHDRGAWVHVDGAFGLWAAVSPVMRERLAGVEDADSWATDAHKTLNVPYDCGLAIVSRPEALRRAFGVHTSYLIATETGLGDPLEKVPEMSRRARGIPVWAALRQLGKSGVIAMVERLASNARALAEGLAAIPGVEVLNEVAFTQVSVSFGSDDRTHRVTQRLMAEGAVWMSGSSWRGRDILRISVSNWTTDAKDVAASIEAVRGAVRADP